MRIAIFHNLPSGGAKRALYGFVKQLAVLGHEVNGYIPETADESFLPLKPFLNRLTVFPVDSLQSKATLPQSILRQPKTRFQLGELEEVQKQIAETLNDSSEEIILVEQDRFTMSPFLLKYLQKPAVYYCQQPVRGLANDHAVRNRLHSELRKIRGGMDPVIDRTNALSAKYTLANSEFSKMLIERSYGFSPYVCYLGVDPETFSPIRVQPSQKKYVMSVGMCRRAKGFDFLIKALGKIEQNKRPSLMIVSNRASNTWKLYLGALAAAKGVDVEIRLQVEDPELVMLYNQAQTVVYAPRQEPFGFVPLEAMACGTPVVAVREGGPQETVIDGVTGILVERDVQSFADAVVEVMHNPRLRQEMVERGHEAIQTRWTLEKAGERLVGHLRTALHSTSGSSCLDSV